jgi:hypothetical protein
VLSGQGVNGFALYFKCNDYLAQPCLIRRKTIRNKEENEDNTMNIEKESCTMNMSPILTNGMYIVTGALGILTVLLVFAHLTGKLVPLISGDRAAFIALVIIAFLIRSSTIVRLPLTRSYWIHPIAIVVCVLGALALLLIIAVFAGIKLPLIAGDREAFIALAVIVFSKLGLAIVHRII